jgi:transposase-like protein
MGTSGVALDKSKIIEAIYQKRGVIEQAAKALGCNPCSIYNWMNKDEEIKQSVDEARELKTKERMSNNEELLDLAYLSTHHLLNRKDVTTTIFIMKTLGGLKEAQGIAIPQCIVRGQFDNNRPDTALQAPLVSEAV